MDTIIGLGQAGCNIAEKFSNYPQYTIYKIDTDLEEDHRENVYTYSISSENHPEEYERNCPDFDDFFVNASDNILFICCGAGYISAMALRILTFLKNKKINILYIKPDIELLGIVERQHEKVVYNVLQEYARSGVFKNVYLVNNLLVQKLLGDLTIIEYYDKINAFIANTMHMLNVYMHNKPVYDSYSESYDTTRISTIGILDIESNEEKYLFSLAKTKEKCYIYAINKQQVETDGTLFSNCIENVKQRSENGTIKTSLGIYSTQYEQNYAYIIALSQDIQE